MLKLEPTYLRYVIDNLKNGTIGSGNPSALPYGFVDVYEKNISQLKLLQEREELLNYLTLWALLKEAVSINLAAFILGVDKRAMMLLIEKLSSWFNSPEPGKYQLYHERIRIYILSKVNDSTIGNITELIISFCQNVITDKLPLEREFVEYALKNYTRHLVNLSYYQYDYYNVLIEYSLRKELPNIHFKYFESLQYLNNSYEDAIKRAIELNKDDDLFALLGEKVRSHEIILEKLKLSYKEDLSHFTHVYFSVGLNRDEIFYKQYLLLSSIKLFKLIKEDVIQQAHIDSVFDKLDKSEYCYFFKDLREITSELFISNLIINLEQKDLECAIIFEHLPDDFQLIHTKDENFFTKHILSSYPKIKNSDVLSFITDHWNADLNSDDSSKYFTSIDDPLFFQDKLMELYEFAAANDDLDTLISALECTKSKLHYSELLTLFINKSQVLEIENGEIIVNKLLKSEFEISYFKVTDRLRFVVDKLLIEKNFKKLKRLLFSLDRNSFEYYMEYVLDSLLEDKDMEAAESMLLLVVQYMKSYSLSSKSALIDHLSFKYAKGLLLEFNKVDPLAELNLSENHMSIINRESRFFQLLEQSEDQDLLTIVLRFHSDYIKKNKESELNYQFDLGVFKLSASEIQKELIEKLIWIFNSAIYEVIDFEKSFISKGILELRVALAETEVKIKDIFNDIENEWNLGEGIDLNDFFNLHSVSIRKLENISNQIEILRVSPESIDLFVLVTEEISRLKKQIPAKYLDAHLDNLTTLLIGKLRSSKELSKLREQEVHKYFSGILEVLISEVESKIIDSNESALLIFLSSLKGSHSIKEYIIQSLIKLGLDEWVVQLFSNTPSFKLIIEALGKLNLKTELFHILKDGYFSQYSMLIFKNYFGPSIVNIQNYIENLELLSEESLNEAYYNLGLRIVESQISFSTLKAVDKLYFKDFIRGFIENILTNKLEVFKNVKFLYYHLLSVTDVADDLLDEILLFAKFCNLEQIEKVNSLHDRLDSIYTHKILTHV